VNLVNVNWLSTQYFHLFTSVRKVRKSTPGHIMLLGWPVVIVFATACTSADKVDN
jgi:hypothetical protein